MKKTFLYILVISIFFFGCKKYPEDKALVHLQTAKNRLWRGNPWFVTKYTVNGVDSLTYLNSYYLSKAPVEDAAIKFYKTEIKDDCKKMQFGWLNVGKASPTPYLWEIKRLDKNVLCVELVGYNNIIYRLEMIGSQ
jgi:hypothetical protein